MPPANQGSKGALITWTVVATVFGITCAVLALVAYAGQSDAENRLEQERARYRDIIADSELGGTVVTELRASQQAAGSRENLLSYAVRQASQLAEQATGNASVAEAQAAIERNIGRVNTRLQELGQNGQAATLTAAVDNALQAVSNLQQELASLRQTNEELQQTLASQQSDYETRLASMQEQVTQAQERAQTAVSEAGRARVGLQNLTSSVDEQVTQLAGDAATQLRELDDQLAELRGTNTTLREQVGRLTNLLQTRVGGEQLLTQPDGQVIRSPSENRLTINLGRRNSITRGMTFEVYDSVRGIPPVSGTADNPEMPQGKASIEVIRVTETSSEARVISQQPGSTVREGDLVANLAYDPNVPVRFRVYGDFDLENDGNPGPQDRQRLESLLREFGGEIVPEITVDTDIVVLGKQPQVPEFTPEQLRNPVNVQAQYEAQRRLDEYNDVMQRALELNKSVLNQNQLLYYIGYFDQAAR